MNLSRRIALALLLAFPLAWTIAQQGGRRGGANNPFPGGTNPDGSLRPTPPLTRLFSQDAYTEYALLAPGSEQFWIRYLPEETRAGATELVNATRGGSEGSGVEVYDPRHAADSGSGRRHRPRPDLQDIQGRAHLHDARRGHRVGPQPEWIPAGRGASAGLLVHFLEHRRSARHAAGRPAEAGLRQPQRPKQSGDDSRPQDDRQNGASPLHRHVLR